MMKEQNQKATDDTNKEEIILTTEEKSKLYKKASIPVIVGLILNVIIIFVICETKGVKEMLLWGNSYNLKPLLANCIKAIENKSFLILLVIIEIIIYCIYQKIFQRKINTAKVEYKELERKIGYFSIFSTIIIISVLSLIIYFGYISLISQIYMQSFLFDAYM